MPLIFGAGSALVIYWGLFAESKIMIGTGIAGLIISLARATGSQWVISNLPKAINLWNKINESDHSFVPYTSIGVTSHGFGFTHTF